MTNLPQVSIIMPAYNAEKYITESIDSVLNQTFEEWELIIINDGSTDSTEDIVKRFQDERIILVSQKNAGVSSARNEGLKKIRGKYLTFLDADDVFPENSLKSRFDYLEENPGIDLVDGTVEVKNERLNNAIRIYQPYYKGNLLPELLKLNDKVFLGICYFFNSKLLTNIQFSENMTHAEDLLFYIQLSSKNNIKYAFVEDIIYLYRNSNDSAMTNLNGLENGYLQLIKEVKKLPNISKIDFLMFKTTIAKIMFLSWLSQKKIANAIKSVHAVFKR